MSRVEAEKSILQQRISKITGKAWSHRHQEKRREGMVRFIMEKKDEMRTRLVRMAQNESWMSKGIQLLKLNFPCCFIKCGPSLCSIAFPARG